MNDAPLHDLVIIGAGPIGLNCAVAATKAQLDYVVLEKGVLTNSIYHYPVNMTFFSTAQKIEIGDIPFVAHSDKPTRLEALEYYRRVMDHYRLRVHFYEEVEGMSPHGEGTYSITTTGGRTYHTRSVIVATGFYDTPRLLGVPGEDLPKVKHYYDDAHPYVQQRVVVVGAANSACDVALELWHKEADVTMVIREDDIYERVKYWIRPNILNRIAEGTIKAHFNSTVQRITPEAVCIRTPDGELQLPNDFVLAMTGYLPNYDLLRRLRLPIADESPHQPIHNPDTLETPLQRVYVAGVVAAGLATSELFIENTRVHATMILDHLTAALRALSTQ